MIGFALLWGLLCTACLCTIWYVLHGYEALSEQSVTSSERIIYTIICGLLALLFGLWARESYRQARGG